MHYGSPDGGGRFYPVLYIQGGAPVFENFANVREFFTSTNWAPSREGDPHFGSLSILYGTLMVTVGSCAVAVPLGIVAAIALSEIVSARLARIFRPVVELFAAIPSVAYGFFAMAVFAPLLQSRGGIMIAVLIALVGLPVALVGGIPVAEAVSSRLFSKASGGVNVAMRMAVSGIFCGAVLYAAYAVSGAKFRAARTPSTPR